MKIHFYFQNVDKIHKDLLEKYITEEKLSRLTPLLQHGNFELADLDLNIEYFKSRNFFSVTLILKIAKQNLVAEKRDYDILKAFDLALDRLVYQLRKLESFRHDK